MANKVKPIPDGSRSVTPYLMVRGASDALEFYKKAFGAEEFCRLLDPQGKIMHAELKFGDCFIFLGDECPGTGNGAPPTYGGTPVSIHLYVEDVDAAHARATAAGATSVMPPMDMFWGDRFTKLVDPFGHSWSLASHIEDVTPEEMQRRSEEFFAQMAKQQAGSAA